MATKNQTQTEESARTEPIDVSNPDQALSLLAAWQGVYHFFKGRVNRWTQNENGNVVAEGFTVDAQYDPETILKDISGRQRRIDFATAHEYFHGAEPEPFSADAPTEMTNFMVNFTKSTGEGANASSKTPEYVRKAVAAYKNEIGIKGRRGRKRSILRLDDINELDNEALVGTSVEQLDRLVALAMAAKAKAVPATTGANA